MSGSRTCVVRPSRRRRLPLPRLLLLLLPPRRRRPSPPLKLIAAAKTTAGCVLTLPSLITELRHRIPGLLLRLLLRPLLSFVRLSTFGPWICPPVSSDAGIFTALSTRIRLVLMLRLSSIHSPNRWWLIRGPADARIPTRRRLLLRLLRLRLLLPLLLILSGRIRGSLLPIATVQSPEGRSILVISLCLLPRVLRWLLLILVRLVRPCRGNGRRRVAITPWLLPIRVGLR